ncbi:MAG: hypothetical protein HMLKMBBP_01018 [Planctomycetes bacterium]|nr:hypothetical protein [Planctomycetota bacterium]
MSEVDKKALEASFAKWCAERVPDMQEDRAFERFVIEQVLKDFDLTDDEIDSGHCGGGDDGGVDAMYIFVNRQLIRDESVIPDPATEVDLVIIQASRQQSHSEASIQKLDLFSRDMFDYAKPVTDLTYLSEKARESVALVRRTYESVMASNHTMRVHFHYGTKSVEPANKKVEARSANIESFIRGTITSAAVQFTYWGCQQLLASARTIPNVDEIIDMAHYFGAKDGSVVCLVPLSSFAAMIRTEAGELKTRLLEPNVRDYQGAKNSVNEEIRNSLTSKSGAEDFWWLNNGVTIIAGECSIGASKLRMKRPEIVNGLQTSHEIFGASASTTLDDKRHVLVRVIVAPDERSRNRIIKATNSQTPVSPLSLRATDRVHFDIEDRLKLYNLFYDRRKGEYRRLRKPVSRIVTMRAVGQAVIAAVLRRPDDARARPQNVLGDEARYKSVFSRDYDPDLYVSCVLIVRLADEYIAKRGASHKTRNNIRYHIVTLLASAVTGKATPTASDVARALPAIRTLSDDALIDAYDAANSIYLRLGADDAAAKSSAMVVDIEKAAGVIAAKTYAVGPTRVV